MARSLSNHKISSSYLDCLQEILKKHCGDSVVVKNMMMKRSKGDYLVAHGISKTYKDETINLLKNCDCFSIGFDESEVNKTSEVEILVKVADKSTGIQLRHYRTIDLYLATAESIDSTILNSFTMDGIDYENKLIAPMTDGCATMEGKKGCVRKLPAEKVPDLKDLGSCNDHHISNSMKHGVNAFDTGVSDVLVHVYIDVGGAKGYGLKKKKEFEAACAGIGIKVKPLKKWLQLNLESSGCISLPFFTIGMDLSSITALSKVLLNVKSIFRNSLSKEKQ